MQNSAVLTALGTPSEFHQLSPKEIRTFVAAYNTYLKQNAVFDIVEDLYGVSVEYIIFLFGPEKRPIPFDVTEKVSGLLVYNDNRGLVPYDFGTDFWTKTSPIVKGRRLDYLYREAYNTLACRDEAEFAEEYPWKQYQAMAEAADNLLALEDTFATLLDPYRDQINYRRDDLKIPYNEELFVRDHQ